MIGSIPNPRKSITVRHSLDKLLILLPNLCSEINEVKSGYTQHSIDLTIGELQVLKTEFLSLGVKIIINLCYLEPEITKIEIEVQRMIGSFDQSHEVTAANKHLDVVTKAISNLISENPIPNTQERPSSNFHPSSIDPLSTLSNPESSSSAGIATIIVGIIIGIIAIYFFL